MSDDARSRLDSWAVLLLAPVFFAVTWIFLKALSVVISNCWLHIDHSSWQKTNGSLASLTISATGDASKPIYHVDPNYSFNAGGQTYLGKDFYFPAARYATSDEAKSAAEKLLALVDPKMWEKGQGSSLGDLRLKSVPKPVTVLFYPPDPHISMLVDGLALFTPLKRGLYQATEISIVLIMGIAFLSFLWLDLRCIFGLYTFCADLFSKDHISSPHSDMTRYFGAAPPRTMEDFLEWTKYGEFLLDSKQYEKAFAALNTAYNICPGKHATAALEIDITLLRGECLLALGRFEEANSFLLDAQDRLKEIRNEELDAKARILEGVLTKRSRQATSAFLRND